MWWGIEKFYLILCCFQLPQAGVGNILVWVWFQRTALGRFIYCLEVTLVVIWRCITKTEMNWIFKGRNEFKKDRSAAIYQDDKDETKFHQDNDAKHRQGNSQLVSEKEIKAAGMAPKICPQQKRYETGSAPENRDGYFPPALWTINFTNLEICL